MHSSRHLCELSGCHLYLHMDIFSQVQWVLTASLSIGYRLPIRFSNAVEAFGCIQRFYILTFFQLGHLGLVTLFLRLFDVSHGSDYSIWMILPNWLQVLS